MTEARTEKPAFNIGIAMAGAVSGGAYSAGVFDFLMEALDQWQKAKDKGEDVPKHEVFISALSGTSAGGITAAMGLAALAGGIRPVEQPSANPACSDRIKRTLPELYDIWVKKVRLFGLAAEASRGGAGAGPPTLLDTSDIKRNGPPNSLLNSEVLTNIARDGLSSIRSSGQRFPFFSEPTHLFLTHTNLDGIPYPIEFTPGDGYTMMLHEGRAHFAVRDLGSRPYPSECNWLARWGDLGLDIHLAELGSIAPIPPDPALKEPFESFAQAALTTSAFPFGFSARRVTIDTAKMRAGAMPFDPGTFAAVLQGDQLESLPQNEDEKHAHFVCIDGGAMNNEPFEIVRWAIRDPDEPRNARDPKTANRAVILIAPFPPSASADLKELANKNRDIGIAIIGKGLIPALINQARFKASDLIAASDPKVYSRFLISPSRLKDRSKPALASSPLQAFGGFLDEQFREHDFQLGRRNCQWFLRQHFCLHRSNPVFGLDAARFYASIEDPAHPLGEEWPIIPLVGSASKVIPLLPWPLMPRRRLLDLRAALRRRFDLLVAAFASQVLKRSPSLRFAARLSWWQHRKEIIARVIATIESELVSSSQMEPAPAPGVLARWWGRAYRPWAAGLLIVLAVLAAAFVYLAD